MKHILLVVFLLSSKLIIAQTNTLIVIDQQGNDDCGYQAFIIKENRTYIDRCYLGEEDDWNDLKEIPEEPIFQKLQQLGIEDFYRISGDINYTAFNKPCDALLPILFVIGDKIIEWARIDNCFPDSAREYAEEIIKVFEKY